MLSPAATSLSGMNAAQAALSTAAHNLANLQTEGFRRQRAEPSTQSPGGVGVHVTRAAEPGHGLETDLVGLLQAKNAFLANLAVFKADDAMRGSLLDAVG